MPGQTPFPAASSGEQSRLEFPGAELLGVRVLPAQFARICSVSKQTVSRWIKAGTVTLGADGRLDPNKAMRELICRADPGRLRARLIRQATVDVVTLRAEASRAAQLEQALSDANVRLRMLDEDIRQIDSALASLPNLLVESMTLIRSTPASELVELFGDLIERAVLEAGVFVSGAGDQKGGEGDSISGPAKCQQYDAPAEAETSNRVDT